jgi:hypothetical protein
MKHLFSMMMVVLLLAAALCVGQDSSHPGVQASPAQTPSAKNPAVSPEQENVRKARELIDQALTALGGQAYLNVHDMQEQGRTYSFYHGRPTSNGVQFWRFLEYPDKERIEVTPQRDIAYVYVGDKGYEITYKGTKQIEKKDMDDYVRRHRFSLEVILRTWVNDPGVALFFDGAALAGSMSAQKITLINAKDEAVSLYFDIDTHLPIMKTYSWRDPKDGEKNVEEETFDNYRPAGGVMVAYGFTRYFNGDIQSERFVNSASCNKGLNAAMFDPNSGYNPIKAEGKKK